MTGSLWYGRGCTVSSVWRCLLKYRSLKREVYFRTGAQILQKSRSHLKILGTRRVTCSKSHTEDPQTLGATVQNLVTTVT